MHIDLERKLLIKYPAIFGVDHYVSGTEIKWDIACGDGWYDLLDTLFRDIQTYIDLAGAPQVKLVQIKEKFGVLSISYAALDKNVDSLIRKATTDSKLVCENCGCFGMLKRTRHGWIKSLCIECLDRLNSE